MLTPPRALRAVACSALAETRCQFCGFARKSAIRSESDRCTAVRGTDTLVLPYLYGYSYYERHGVMIFGEQEHGDQGIRDQLGQLYQAPPIEGVEEYLRLTGLHKRVANKRPCPCRSGRRLGRCHNRVVNALRSRLGRHWFRDEYENVCSVLGKPGSRKRRVAAKPPTVRELLSPQPRVADGEAMQSQLNPPTARDSRTQLPHVSLARLGSSLT